MNISQPASDAGQPMEFAVRLHSTEDDTPARPVYIGAGASLVVVPDVADDGTVHVGIDVTDLLPQTAADLLRLAAEELEARADAEILKSLEV